jgi:hypothetical protein
MPSSISTTAGTLVTIAMVVTMVVMMMGGCSWEANGHSYTGRSGIDATDLGAPPLIGCESISAVSVELDTG